MRLNIVSTKIILFLLALLFAMGCSANREIISGTDNPSSQAPQEKDESKVAQTDMETGSGNVNFPEKPIRLVITHPAGSGTDNAARILHPSLEKLFDQPIIIENMPGAGGNLARAHVYKEAPDGYTLLVSQLPSLMIGEIVLDGGFKSLEMTPIVRFMGKQTLGLMVKNDSPWETFQDAVEASKEKRLTVAGPGTANNGALSYALFSSAGLIADYVPFEGGPEVQMAVIGGQVDMGVADTTSLHTANVADEVRVLAVNSEERNINAPDAPTLVELGFPDLHFETSIGVFGPPDIPTEIAQILGDTFFKAANDPEFHERAQAASYQAAPMDPEEFKSLVLSNYQVVENFKDILME